MILIASMVKDEHRDIREWALWHRAIGCDHITLYDNNSSHGYESEIGDLIEQNYIDVKSWPRTEATRQLGMYNDFCFNRNWTSGDWVAFIDPDEFISLDAHETITGFVRAYDEHPGVALSWRCYGADGHVERPTTPVKLSYLKPAPKVRENHNFKSLVRPAAVSYWPDVHRAVMRQGFLVNTRGEPVHDSNMADEYHAAHLDHYITKSWQDWLARLERGNVTRGIRKISTFFDYNPDMLDRYTDLTSGLDPSRFPTTQTDRELLKLQQELFKSDMFIRLSEVEDPAVPDDVFGMVCVLELANFATLRLSRIKGKTADEMAAIHARMNELVDKQIQHLRSLPRDLPNYRRHVVETIISTPFGE